MGVVYHREGERKKEFIVCVCVLKSIVGCVSEKSGTERERVNLKRERKSSVKEREILC